MPTKVGAESSRQARAASADSRAGAGYLHPRSMAIGPGGQLAMLAACLQVAVKKQTAGKLCYCPGRKPAATTSTCPQSEELFVIGAGPLPHARERPAGIKQLISFCYNNKEIKGAERGGDGKREREREREIERERNADWRSWLHSSSIPPPSSQAPWVARPASLAPQPSPTDA